MKIKTLLGFCAVSGILLIALMIITSGFLYTESGFSSTTSTENIETGYNNSILKDLGVREPAVSQIPLLRYSDATETINTIIQAGKIPLMPENVIGMFDYGRHKSVLVKNNASVFLIRWDGTTATESEIEPRLIAQKIQGSPISTEKKDYAVDWENNTGVYDLSIPRPENASDIQHIILLKISRADHYRDNNQKIIATVVTAADFYIDYGRSVAAVVDKSSVTIDPINGKDYAGCKWSTENNNAGTAVGQVLTHFKFGTLTWRGDMNAWVSSDAWLRTSDYGYFNHWTPFRIPLDRCTY